MPLKVIGDNLVTDRLISGNYITSLSRLQQGPEALEVHFEIIDNVIDYFIWSSL